MTAALAHPRRVEVDPAGELGVGALEQLARPERAERPRADDDAAQRPGRVIVAKLTRTTRRAIGLSGTSPRTPARRRPPDGVGDHPLHVGVVVDRVLLVAGAEVEDPPGAAPEAAAAAEHLAARERADEHELVGRGDVEVLAVHLLRLDHDRLRHAGGDRMRRVHGPHQLALALVAPAQAARGAEQAAEHLRVVARSAARAAPCRPAPRRAPARRPRRRPPRGPRAPTRSARRSRPAPPRAARARAGPAWRCGPARAPPSCAREAGRDRGVHPVGVDLAHRRVAVLVEVLAPHGDAHRGLVSGLAHRLQSLAARRDRLDPLVPAPGDLAAAEVDAADPAVDAVERDVVELAVERPASRGGDPQAVWRSTGAAASSSGVEAVARRLIASKHHVSPRNGRVSRCHVRTNAAPAVVAPSWTAARIAPLGQREAVAASRGTRGRGDRTPRPRSAARPSARRRSPAARRGRSRAAPPTPPPRARARRS